MAKIEFNDFDEYLDKLQKLEKGDVVPIMKMSLYEGTGVVVDGIRSEIQSLHTSNHASQGPMELQKLEKGDVVPIMKMSLYEGTGVVVDGIRSEIQSLHTSNHASQGPMDYEKKALEKGLGISDMESKGDDINVKVGFAGYSSHKKRSWYFRYGKQGR